MMRPERSASPLPSSTSSSQHGAGEGYAASATTARNSGSAQHWLREGIDRGGDVLRKAVVPIAGLGTRMFPMSAIVPKAFLPIVSLPAQGGVAAPPLIRPFLHTLLRYVLDPATGIDEVCVIISADQRGMIESYFDMNRASPTSPSIWDAYTAKGKHFLAEVEEIREIGRKLSLAVQEEPKGFGHAVLCTEGFIGSDEWFLLLLGDHLYTTPEANATSITSLLGAFRKAQPRVQMTSVGVIEASAAPVSGVLLCSGLDPDTRVCSVEAMIEKPSASQATAGCLAPPEFGLPAGSVLCNFGMDILPQKVFSVLKAQGATPSGEVELRTAQADLLDMEGMRGVLMRGKHLDTGLPEPYLDALRLLADEGGGQGGAAWTHEEVSRLATAGGKQAWGEFAGRGRAPGRLDVMGGVSDYSGATVLQCPTSHLSTLASVCAGNGRGEIKVTTTDETASPPSTETYTTDASTLLASHNRRRHALPDDAPPWAAYVLGILLVLHEDAQIAWTLDTLIETGFSCAITSNLPRGAGLSSSASVEVAFARALLMYWRLPVPAMKIARVCQRAEHEVAHAPCGIMDQIAVTYGLPGHLLSISCRPEGATVGDNAPLPRGVRVWGVVSGAVHSVAGGGYSRARCAAFMGLSLIREAGAHNLSCLADLSPSEFASGYEGAGVLPENMQGEAWGGRQHCDPLTKPIPGVGYAVRASAQHPVDENYRGRLFMSLLASGKGKEAGELMMQSHASYTRIGLGSPAADKIMCEVRAVVRRGGALWGGRISGGGEGGTVVVIGEEGRGDEEVERIAAAVGGYVVHGTC